MSQEQQSSDSTPDVATLQEELEQKEIRIKSLQEELEQAESQAEEYKNDLQRIQAEFQNYKKRVQEEKEEYQKFARKELMEGLTRVLDDFERAIDQLQDTDANIEGIEMIFDNLHQQLQDEGITPIQAEGNKFDPERHECIRQVDSEEENGTVIAEYQRGYMFHDKVLRPAKVIVSGDTNE